MRLLATWGAAKALRKIDGGVEPRPRQHGSPSVAWDFSAAVERVLS